MKKYKDKLVINDKIEMKYIWNVFFSKNKWNKLLKWMLLFLFYLEENELLKIKIKPTIGNVICI